MNDLARQELAALLGERLSVDEVAREEHGRDASYFAPAPPDAVAFPERTEEVQELARICSRHGVAMIPFGAGTAVEGQVLATRGGISVDTVRMDRVLAVHDEDFDVVVQPGVRRLQLAAHLEGSGLFFPVDPGADASLGGMASTRASGTNTVRYGTMREHVLALQVVLADGRVIHTGSRARKSSAGYDLTHLFVGAEGTLGIITELTLRLHPVPAAISAAVCAFPDVAAAVNTVIAVMQAGGAVARMELLDARMIEAVNAYSGMEHAVSPTLFFEFHGTERSVGEQAEAVQGIAREHGGENFGWSTAAEERGKLWKARHDVYYAVREIRPGSETLATDVCVPISALAECIEKTREDLAGTSLIAPLVGHVGDGNFHLVVVVDPANDAELAEATALKQRLTRRALDLGGTCSGEHGIGLGKLDFLDAEHGDGVDVMRSIKRALDPQGLLNPGKLPG